MSCIHFKFKSSLDYDTIKFDGLNITLEKLRLLIHDVKSVGKTSEFDIQIVNAQTKEEYTDDSEIIPRNTSIIIARVPVKKSGLSSSSATLLSSSSNTSLPTTPNATIRSESNTVIRSASNMSVTSSTTALIYGSESSEKIPSDRNNCTFDAPREPIDLPEPVKDTPKLLSSSKSDTSLLSINDNDDSNREMTLEELKKIGDLTSVNASEDDKIMAMMTQSNLDYDTSQYTKSSPGQHPSNAPPRGYVCYKCNMSGHFIAKCTANIDLRPPRADNAIRVRTACGIPKAFMSVVDDPNAKGAVLTSTGEYAVPKISMEAYKETKKEKRFSLENFHDEQFAKISDCDKNISIPGELRCMICKDILNDAVIIHCCGNSFCDDCIRCALVESEGHMCPACGEKDISPNTLTPNKFIRKTVINFRNELGLPPMVSRSSEPLSYATFNPAPHLLQPSKQTPAVTEDSPLDEFTPKSESATTEKEPEVATVNPTESANDVDMLDMLNMMKGNIDVTTPINMDNLPQQLQLQQQMINQFQMMEQYKSNQAYLLKLNEKSMQSGTPPPLMNEPDLPQTFSGPAAIEPMTVDYIASQEPIENVVQPLINEKSLEQTYQPFHKKPIESEQKIRPKGNKYQIIPDSFDLYGAFPGGKIGYEAMRRKNNVSAEWFTYLNEFELYIDKMRDRYGDKIFDPAISKKITKYHEPRADVRNRRSKSKERRKRHHRHDDHSESDKNYYSSSDSYYRSSHSRRTKRDQRSDVKTHRDYESSRRNNEKQSRRGGERSDRSSHLKGSSRRLSEEMLNSAEEYRSSRDFNSKEHRSIYSKYDKDRDYDRKKSTDEGTDLSSKEDGKFKDLFEPNVFQEMLSKKRESKSSKSRNKDNKYKETKNKNADVSNAFTSTKSIATDKSKSITFKPLKSLSKPIYGAENRPDNYNSDESFNNKSAYDKNISNHISPGSDNGAQNPLKCNSQLDLIELEHQKAVLHRKIQETDEEEEYEKMKENKRKDKKKDLKSKSESRHRRDERKARLYTESDSSMDERHSRKHRKPHKYEEKLVKKYSSHPSESESDHYSSRNSKNIIGKPESNNYRIREEKHSQNHYEGQPRRNSNKNVDLDSYVNKISKRTRKEKHTNKRDELDSEYNRVNKVKYHESLTEDDEISPDNYTSEPSTKGTNLKTIKQTSMIESAQRDVNKDQIKNKKLDSHKEHNTTDNRKIKRKHEQYQYPKEEIERNKDTPPNERSRHSRDTSPQPSKRSKDIKEMSAKEILERAEIVLLSKHDSGGTGIPPKQIRKEFGQKNVRKVERREIISDYSSDEQKSKESHKYMKESSSRYKSQPSKTNSDSKNDRSLKKKKEYDENIDKRDRNNSKELNHNNKKLSTSLDVEKSRKQSTYLGNPHNDKNDKKDSYKTKNNKNITEIPSNNKDKKSKDLSISKLSEKDNYSCDSKKESENISKKISIPLNDYPILSVNNDSKSYILPKENTDINNTKLTKDIGLVKENKHEVSSHVDRLPTSESDSLALKKSINIDSEKLIKSENKITKMNENKSSIKLAENPKLKIEDEHCNNEFIHNSEVKSKSDLSLKNLDNIHGESIRNLKNIPLRSGEKLIDMKDEKVNKIGDKAPGEKEQSKTSDKISNQESNHIGDNNGEIHSKILKSNNKEACSKDIVADKTERSSRDELPKRENKYSDEISNIEMKSSKYRRPIKEDKLSRDEKFIKEKTYADVRSTRENKQSKDEISNQENKYSKDEKPNRENRYPKNEISNRENKYSKDERFNRENKYSKDERSNRDNKYSKDEIPSRENRYPKDERSNQENKYSKDEILNRENRFSKNERSNRENRYSRDERLNRDYTHNKIEETYATNTRDRNANKAVKYYKDDKYSERNNHENVLAKEDFTRGVHRKYSRDEPYSDEAQPTKMTKLDTRSSKYETIASQKHLRDDLSSDSTDYIRKRKHSARRSPQNSSSSSCDRKLKKKKKAKSKKKEKHAETRFIAEENSSDDNKKKKSSKHKKHKKHKKSVK